MENGMEKVLEVKELTKYYGNNRGIEGVSFEVVEGEVIGLLGPNGAGKTTTMNIITGVMSATSGEVKVAGYDIFDEPIEAKKRIGYLPEYPPLYANMTVYEYLDYAGSLRELSGVERKERIEYVVEKCGLRDVFRRLIGNLSKGYQQRVGIAQAILHNPKLLVLDEPTIGLDPKQIVEIRELVKEIGKEHTIIFSSHILPEVSQICSRIIVINDGRIVADDTQENLSKRLQEASAVFVRFLNVDSGAIHRFRAYKEIKNVRKEGDGFVVEAEKDIEVAPIVFDFAVKENLVIRELRPLDLTLEEVFIKLITREGV
jgi:ABC-2 type transport system ATP-binding protein